MTFYTTVHEFLHKWCFTFVAVAILNRIISMSTTMMMMMMMTITVLLLLRVQTLLILRRRGRRRLLLNIIFVTLMNSTTLIIIIVITVDVLRLQHVSVLHKMWWLLLLMWNILHLHGTRDVLLSWSTHVSSNNIILFNMVIYIIATCLIEEGMWHTQWRRCWSDQSVIIIIIIIFLIICIIRSCMWCHTMMYSGTV